MKKYKHRSTGETWYLEELVDNGLTGLFTTMYGVKTLYFDMQFMVQVDV